MDKDDERLVKVLALMNRLGIPFQLMNYYHTGGPKCGPSGYPIGGTVSIFDLYDILMDDEKFKVISSTLKNKAFW